MKLSIDPQTLAETVTWAVRAITQRPAIPILAGLLLEAADDQLTVSAFDYDFVLQATVTADVSEPGRVVLPGRVLAEIAKDLPGGNFADLALSGREMAITCGRLSYTLVSLPVEDYPSIPEAPPILGTADGAVLATAIQQVATAATKDNTLPMLTGIRWDISEDTLSLAATDRYRIAVRDLPWTPHVTGKVDGVVAPHGHLLDAAKGGMRGTVSVGWDGSRIGFQYEGRTVITRLLDSQFIDYTSRTEYGDLPILATIDRALIMGAVKRAARVAEKNTAVRLAFSSDEVLVQAGTADVARGAETVPCELTGADVHEIAFQPQFLLDALTGVQQDKVLMHMQPGNKPALISGQESDSYRCLVMVLRLA
ncbi:DNA polymerase III subunit beta [Acrocarpospora catenulata]|uniref:DNA polymerase III subunit beta n=1 Tax=Acrocarpospora catenulata TaxID=2836182 RepID=UPI001BDB396C|nr:DNA polymerase III subunit beta [Acrocarpospora catenulata]